MTREEAIKQLDTMWKMLTSAYDDIADSHVAAYTMAVDALKAQGTCEDAVSRQTLQKELALYTIDDVTSEDEAGYNRAINDVQKMALHLPSAQPEPSQVARDIATIIENEQDMRVVLKNAQNDIVHCRNCKFCHKSLDWKHLQSFGMSIWRCGKCRGLNVAETVNLDDYCSSAERRTDERTD